MITKQKRAGEKNSKNVLIKNLTNGFCLFIKLWLRESLAGALRLEKLFAKTRQVKLSGAFSDCVRINCEKHKNIDNILVIIMSSILCHITKLSLSSSGHNLSSRASFFFFFLAGSLILKHAERHLCFSERNVGGGGGW